MINIKFKHKPFLSVIEPIWCYHITLNVLAYPYLLETDQTNYHFKCNVSQFKKPDKYKVPYYVNMIAMFVTFYKVYAFEWIIINW